MTGPSAATTGTPSVAAVSIEFPPHLLPGVFEQAVHTLAN
jgi:hypothetical protein